MAQGPRSCRAVARASSELRTVSSATLYGNHSPKIFNVMDSEHPYFRFEGELKDGVLEFEAFLIDPERNIRSAADGKALFREMIAHFGANNIKAVKSRWFGGTNLDRFMDGIDKGLTEEESAKDTWSGRMASEFGFSQVHRIRIVERTSTKPLHVIAHFVRP